MRKLLFWTGGRPAGRPGEIDNKAISAPAKLELGLGLSLAKIRKFQANKRHKNKKFLRVNLGLC